MYKMVVTPAPSLLEKATVVEKFDKKLHLVLKEMRETLDATRDPVGVGLAAPQVGIPKRIFLAKPKDDTPATAFINPEIIQLASEQAIPHFENSAKIEAHKPKSSKRKLLEGCLSIPNIWGNVSRAKKVKITWQDETGKKHNKIFTGFAAIIIQHEMDHLNGILFTKHVMSQGEKLYRSYKNEKGEDEFDEIEV